MRLFGIIIETEKKRALEFRQACDSARENARYALIYSDGYKECLESPPPRDRKLLFMRTSWVKPVIMQLNHCHEAMNVYGLYWKPILEAKP